MNTDLKIIIGAIIASVAIIVGAVFVLGKDNAPKRESLGSAAMTIDKTNEDFGSMKVSDERTATFMITNTSSSVLRIWNIGTSCDCTFATLVINGKASPEFNMAGMMGAALRNWIGEVPAGGKAELNVTYRPKVMPVSGPITRQVNFSTNDPKNENVQVGIAANVL